MTRNGQPPNRPPTRPQAAPLPRPLRLEQPGHIGDIADPARPVLGLKDDHGPHETGWHRHRRCQLLYAIRGVMTAHTRDGTWVVPPQQAVWLPAGIEHNVIATRGMAMRSLYMEPAACHGMPETCCVLPVPPLLRRCPLRFPSPWKRTDACPPVNRWRTLSCRWMLRPRWLRPTT